MACVVTVNKHDIYINDGLGMGHPQCLRYIYTEMINRLGSETGNHYQLPSVAFARVTEIPTFLKNFFEQRRELMEAWEWPFAD